MIKVFIIAAISADGFIGKNEKENSMSWTSPEDRKFFVTMTKRARVMVMGRKTFETIGKALPGRTTIVYTKKKSDFPSSVETTSLSPKELLGSLEKKGFTEVAICGGTSIYSLFLKENAVDELYLTVEGILFGSGIKFLDHSLERTLTLLSTQQIGPNTVVLHYKISH